MQTTVLDVHTGSQSRVTDLSGDIARFLAEVNAEDGLLHVFVPHATAGVAIIETGAGSDEDLLTALDDTLPRNRAGEWIHQHGTPGHGRDHVVPAYLAPFTVVPVLSRELALGTWQSVCLVDTNVDNPDRTVRLSFLSGLPG